MTTQTFAFRSYTEQLRAAQHLVRKGLIPVLYKEGTQYFVEVTK